MPLKPFREICCLCRLRCLIKKGSPDHKIPAPDSSSRGCLQGRWALPASPGLGPLGKELSVAGPAHAKDYAGLTALLCFTKVSLFSQLPSLQKNLSDLVGVAAAGW